MVGLLATAAVKASGNSLSSTLESLSLKVKTLLTDIKDLKNELAEDKDFQVGSSNNIQMGVPSILSTDAGFGSRATDASGAPKDLVQGHFWTAMPATGVNTSTAFMTNSTGRAVLLDLERFHVQFSGTVSSSVDISCATSTRNGINIYTTELTLPFLTAFRLVTSTVGTTEQGVATPTTTLGLAYLANTESVVCRWFASVGNSNGCTGAFCESVSSSNRGYNANVFAPWIYAADPQ